jgi:hypothetical protein
MENDAPVVGPDAPTANSKMVKLDIATAGLESANFRFVRHAGPIPIVGHIQLNALGANRDLYRRKVEPRPPSVGV